MEWVGEMVMVMGARWGKEGMQAVGVMKESLDRVPPMSTAASFYMGDNYYCLWGGWEGETEGRGVIGYGVRGA